MQRAKLEIEALDEEASEQERPYVGAGNGRNDTCRMGEIFLGKQLSSNEIGRVFIAEIGATDKPKIIKYATDCRVRSGGKSGISLHPLIHEYIFMRSLSETGLVPEVEYISPSQVLKDIPESQGPRSLRTLATARCTRLGSEARFLIQEKAGMNLSQFFRLARNQPRKLARRAIVLTINLVILLRRIHSHGIVHNDIHHKNVVFKTDKITGELVLIDFEFAEYFVSQLGEPIERPRRTELVESNLSPWHLLDQRPGRRDDVFRAIEKMAETLSLGSLRAEYNQAIQEGLEEVGNPQDQESPEYLEVVKRVALDHKLHKPLFTEYCNEKIGFKKDHVANAQTVLEGIINHIRAYSHPDDEPDYEYIVKELHKALAYTDK